MKYECICLSKFGYYPEEPKILKVAQFRRKFLMSYEVVLLKSHLDYMEMKTRIF